MACDQWQGKLDAYVDGELDPAEVRALGAHLPGCPTCAADILERVQLKRSVHTAGKRYAASPELRNRISKIIPAKPRRQMGWYWQILAIPALLLLFISVAVNFYMGRESARRQRVYSELADLHVAALASALPVDVISTDRHTVKPWFQGKIPFTFNLPELQGSPFTLIGGRVTYLAQAPGAHLIYQVRKHEISVFIFQEFGADAANLPSGPVHAVSFNAESWTQNGLRYFVIGDTGREDILALSKLLRDAG
jgi:anti-sigma factor RsiW